MYKIRRGGGGYPTIENSMKIFLVNPFLRLYSKFQSPTLPETGPKVCVCVFVVGGWLKPILVFSLAQDEQ